MPDDLRSLVAAAESEAMQDAHRAMDVCNACRYCESYCAVFPAMGLRREFTTGDLTYLANLCHGCKGCYYACQYAPPHAYGVNLPKHFAEVRNESYAQLAWPGALGRVFEANGTLVALVTAFLVAASLILTAAFQDSGVLFGAHSGPGAFYRVIPWGLMAGLFGAVFLFALLSMAISTVRFWRTTGASAAGRLKARPLAEALHDIFTLRNLGGGGHGCNDRDGSFSMVKRRLHHAMFYGFLLCFASTSTATIMDHFFGLEAPYGFFSLPVLLGTLGGIGLILGCAGLIWLKVVSDPEPVARRLLGGEYALLFLLLLIAVTGLVLLVARDTVAMGLLLAVHLGFVMALFAMMPFSKFIHGIYRSAALLRHAMERPR